MIPTAAYGKQVTKIQRSQGPDDADTAPRHQMGPRDPLAGHTIPAALGRHSLRGKPGRVGGIHHACLLHSSPSSCYAVGAYRPLLWRLRNRLIVTYLFIGVMPICCCCGWAAVAGYLFRRPVRHLCCISDLHSELLHLQAANDALAAQLFPLESGGKLNEKIAGEFTRASDERFPGRTVTVWARGKGLSSPPEESCFPSRRRRCPILSVADLTGFVVDQDALHLRAIKLTGDGDRRIALISDIPITPNLLVSTAARIGK